MKKYLLFIISMLCVSIGAWADVPTGATAFGENGSYYIIDSDANTITVHIAAQGDMSSYPNNPAPVLTGLTRAVITGEVHSYKASASNGYGSDGALICSTFKDLVVDFSGATLIPIEVDYTSTYTGYCFGGDAKNIIVPNGANPATFQIMSLYTAGSAESGINFYSVSGTTINAAYNSDNNKANLGAVSASAKTLKVVKDFSTSLDLNTVANTTNSDITTIDLTGITTTGSTETNPITVPSTATTVLCSSAGVAARVTPSTNVLSTEISCAASELATKVSALTTKGYKPISITLTGELTSDLLSSFGGTAYSEVTRIDLGEATLASGAAVTDLSLPSTLQELVLPKGQTVSGDLQMRAASCSDLWYIYSPTSSSERTRANQMVADYVWVNKSGGLSVAMNKESGLRQGVYVKIASSVALNNDDAKFGDHGITSETSYSDATDYPWQYVDLSDAVVTEAATVAATAPHAKTYRIILPNNLTGDNLAIFAANSNKGDVAALYSYTGTTLKILGLSASYSPAALADARIVRAGTQEVEFITGTRNSTEYGIFTQTMLDAVNNMGKSSFEYNSETITNNAGLTVKTVRILTNKVYSDNNNTVFNALTFDNPTITILNLSGLTNNATAVVNVNDCTNLEQMTVENTHIASVSGNISSSKLKSVNLTNVTIEGNVSFHNAVMTTFTASGRIAGNIDLTDNNKLGSINIVNVEFKTSGNASTLGNDGDNSGDLIITRNNVTEITNGVYTGVTEGYTKIYDTTTGYANIKTSETFGDGVTGTGKIYPRMTAETKKPYSTDVAGYKQDGCALTITLDGQTEGYTTLATALNLIFGTSIDNHNFSTLDDICNLTINTTAKDSNPRYSLTDDDIKDINSLTFSATAEGGDNANLYRQATLNLDGATLVGNNLLASLAPKSADNTIRNIILPRDLDKNVVNATTFKNFASTANFNGAVSLNAERTQVVGYVKNPGSLRTILYQVPDFRPNVYQYMQNVNLPSVTLSGTLNAADIASSNLNVDTDGNYQATAPLTKGDVAFENLSTLRNLDIKDAVFVDKTKGASETGYYKCDNMTLSELGWGGIVSLKMPTNVNMTEVPARFLRNCQQIRYLCIPYNYETIGDQAFYLAGTNWITTTDSNGAEIDNGINTYTFSKNLKQIGTDPGKYNSTVYPGVPVNPVFGAVTSAEIHDVYFLSSDAPKCWRGAFASGMTYGWGGFDGGNIYCREKYKNGAFLFTVLNFPQGLTEEQEKKYTDITKVYTKKDQTGAVDADGEPIPWPTFSELGRSYNQAIRGLVWNNWNVDTDAQAEGNVNGGEITFDPTAFPANTNEEDTPDYDQFYEYVGLHEFVLAKATYVAPDEEVVNNEIVRYYTLDDWYTFCIPFDMTEAQVAELLGVPASSTKVINEHSSVTYANYLYDSGSTSKVEGTSLMPQIITLKGVARNSTSNLVSLRCSKDLASGEKAKTYYNPATTYYDDNGTIDLGGAAPEKVVIRAGYPYMIRPYVLCSSTGDKQAVEKNNLGKQVLTRYTFKEAASGIHRDGCYEEIGGKITGETSKFAKPWEGHKVQAVSEGSGDSEPLKHTNGKPFNYTFIGQFWKQDLPLNSFYMSGHKWYHYTTKNSAYYWNPYLCIITVSDEDTSSPYYFRTATDNNADANTTTATILPQEVAADEKGHAVFNRQMEIRFKDGLDDSFTSSARMYQFVFEDDIMDFEPDGQATAIEVLDGVRIAPVHGKVYNMAGQQVGNSLEGLSKGMYIVNGKKYVIK